MGHPSPSGHQSLNGGGAATLAHRSQVLGDLALGMDLPHLPIPDLKWGYHI